MEGILDSMLAQQSNQIVATRFSAGKTEYLVQHTAKDDACNHCDWVCEQECPKNEVLDYWNTNVWQKKTNNDTTDL